MLLKAEAEDGIDAAFATLVRDKAGAVLVDADPFFLAKREQVLGWTKAHALPAIYSFREFAVDGGLMSYGTSLANAYHQAGVYAGWINKMAPKPGPFCVRRCLQHYRGSLIREIGADLSSGWNSRTEVGKETIGQWRRLTVAAADPLRWSLALI